MKAASFLLVGVALLNDRIIPFPADQLSSSPHIRRAHEMIKKGEVRGKLVLKCND